MSMIHWRPFQELEEMFEGNRSHAWDLAVDVYQDNGNVIAKMHVPGVNPDNIDIEVEEDHLHVYGEREEEKERKDKDYYRKEICCGAFERVIPLPCHVNEDKITADYKDGVLIITMPKSAHEEQPAKTIKVTRR